MPYPTKRIHFAYKLVDLERVIECDYVYTLIISHSGAAGRCCLSPKSQSKYIVAFTLCVTFYLSLRCLRLIIPKSVMKKIFGYFERFWTKMLQLTMFHSLGEKEVKEEEAMNDILQYES